jgi:hypothetical protein
MPERTARMHQEVTRLADHVVQAYAAGRVDLHALAELCARCEDAGIDHKVVLDEAMRRVGPDAYRHPDGAEASA